MECAADNYNYICHICAKEILDMNFDQAVIDQKKKKQNKNKKQKQKQIFTKLPQISRVHNNHNS